MLSVFIFSLVTDTRYYLNKKDVARAEFELTSPFKKYTEVKVVDRLANN